MLWTEVSTNGEQPSSTRQNWISRTGPRHVTSISVVHNSGSVLELVPGTA